MPKDLKKLVLKKFNTRNEKNVNSTHSKYFNSEELDSHLTILLMG